MAKLGMNRAGMSNAMLSQRRVESLKHNPQGKVFSQEKMLSHIHKQRDELQVQKRALERMDKELERYRAEMKRVQDENKDLRKRNEEQAAELTK